MLIQKAKKTRRKKFFANQSLFFFKLLFRFFFKCTLKKKLRPDNLLKTIKTKNSIHMSLRKKQIM